MYMCNSILKGITDYSFGFTKSSNDDSHDVIVPATGAKLKSTALFYQQDIVHK